MPGIFIGYRRDDVAGHAGRLFDALAGRFGDDLVFMDVESLNPSEHFDVAIERTIARCDVVLVAIGPRWSVERLSVPGDFVHIEIATALRLERPIIPVLIDDAKMPEAAALPEALRAITRSHAFDLEHRTFRRDASLLIAQLEKQIKPASPRRHLAGVLAESGVPYSWFGGLVRRTSPGGALLIVVLAVVAAAMAAAYSAFGIGQAQGYEAGQVDATATYEEQAVARRTSSLVLKGLVTDGKAGLDDAEIKVTNRRNGQAATTRTNDFGHYSVDLKPIGISEDDIVDLQVTKPDYRPSRDDFVFREGFEHRSILTGKLP